MGNESLRQLAQDYALGRINKYDYRHKRHQLIDEITAQPAPAEISSSPAAVSSEVHEPVASHSDYSKPPAASHRVIIAVAIIAIAIIFVTMATSGNNQEPDTLQSTNLTQDHAQQLAIDFINQPEWTSERVSEFVAGWQRLSELEKQQAQQSPWFKELSDTLKDRLAQQQILAKTGSEQAQLNVQTIKSLGRLLSVSL
ncbi:MAG: hypothetical protein AMJ55_05235 [Gammaproteobacteria bacterium SG8_15]|nr:MAG: hypothetical protein AMJ55_05235 [Gammaproteobacteria bacterium SG8_15]